MNIFFFVCADSCIVDFQSNRLSVINVLEEIRVSNFPAAYPTLNIITTLERLENEAAIITGTLTITNDVHTLLSTPIQFDFQNFLRTRAIIGLQGFPILVPGALIVNIEVPGAGSASWKIELISTAAPQQPISTPIPATSVTSPSAKSASVRKSRARKTRPKR